MTNTVQTISKITTVTKDATVRSVAGMGWTVLLTNLRTWQRVPWSLWCWCLLSSCSRMLAASWGHWAPYCTLTYALSWTHRGSPWCTPTMGKSQLPWRSRSCHEGLFLMNKNRRWLGRFLVFKLLKSFYIKLSILVHKQKREPSL